MEEKVLNDQEIARREKLAKYVELGVDPYGKRFDRTDSTKSVKEKCYDLDNEQLEQAQIYVRVAGRMLANRCMGKAAFINIQDKYGSIQAYIGKDVIGEDSYAVYKLCDIGDIVGLYGRVMKTRTGELTIRAEEFTFLTKSLKVLPEKFHGLTDTEERYRRRYVDLIVNDDAKKAALTRPQIIRCVQNYFDSKGFLEVETPILTGILGGASARPFITHHNTLDKDFYLRIALELNLKRLIVGGLEKVYEIGRCFRNEGMDTKHNPEFTLLELYEAYGDLKSMGELCEGVIKECAQKVIKSEVINWNGHEIDLSKPFRWVSMTDLVKEKTGIDFKSDITYEEAKKLAEERHIKVEAHMTGVGHILNAFFEAYCEEDLIQPTFLYGHPIEISPLTKKGEDPRFVERFELYIGGCEFANAYSELNDPIDQRERFEAQLRAKELGDEEASELDEDFLEALEFGMPPTGGIGIGIDRLCMFLTGINSVREVILFPTMKDR